MQIWPNFKILGSCTYNCHWLWPNLVCVSVLSTAKFCLDHFILLSLRGEKQLHQWSIQPNFQLCWVYVPVPFHWSGLNWTKFGMQKYTHGLHLHAKCYLIGLWCHPWGAKPPKFYHIFNLNTLWWCQVAAQRQSWMQMHNYKPSQSKSLHVEVIRTNSTIQKCYRHTKSYTELFCHSEVCIVWDRRHGKVIE